MREETPEVKAFLASIMAEEREKAKKTKKRRGPLHEGTGHHHLVLRGFSRTAPDYHLWECPVEGCMCSQILLCRAREPVAPDEDEKPCSICEGAGTS